MKLSGGNKSQSYGIVFIIFQFIIFPHVYPIGPVYYCPRHSTKTISPGQIDFFGLNKLTYEPLEHCNFIYTQCHALKSLYITQNNIDFLSLELVKITPKDRNYSTILGVLSTQVS